MPLVYDELRALAKHYLERERKGHTLQATALVHEAYLRLVSQEHVDWRDRTHFFAIAAQAIRRILVDHARARACAKRGGDRGGEPLDEALLIATDPPAKLLDLEEAVTELERLSQRQARIVELRLFAGLPIDDIAAVLNISPRTVDEDWSMARAWLRRRLDGFDPG